MTTASFPFEQVDARARELFNACEQGDEGFRPVAFNELTSREREKWRQDAREDLQARARLAELEAQGSLCGDEMRQREALRERFVDDPALPAIRGMCLTRVERESDSVGKHVRVYGQAAGGEQLAAAWSSALGYWGFHDEAQQGYWQDLTDEDTATVEAFVEARS